MERKASFILFVIALVGMVLFVVSSSVATPTIVGNNTCIRVAQCVVKEGRQFCFDSNRPADIPVIQNFSLNYSESSPLMQGSNFMYCFNTTTQCVSARGQTFCFRGMNSSERLNISQA